MSKSTSRAEVEALLAERGRFETWLDQLSAKAATMPAHVVERVRADYQQRLDKVVGDLVSQSENMRGEANELDERVRILAGELSAKRDARAEDELRALVGEYEADAWTVKAAEHDAGIDALESERASGAAEHARVEQLLAEATRPARPMTPVSTAAVESAAPPETRTVSTPTPDVIATAVEELSAPPAAEPATPAEASEPPPRQVKRPSPFDEIGFMRAVVGRSTPYAGVDTTPLDLAPREPRLAPTGVTRTISPVPAPPPVAPPEPPLKDSGERKATPSFEAPPIPDAPIVAPARASSPAIPMIVDESSMVDSMRTSATMPDAARTLKCQECGWMNYPTEWYCEKCGGELAAF